MGMSNLVITIIGGLVVAILASWLGLGGSTTVRIRGGARSSRTGKNIMIFSVIIVFAGLMWASKTTQPSETFTAGHGLAICGVFLFLIGRIIAWYQRS